MQQQLKGIEMQNATQVFNELNSLRESLSRALGGIEVQTNAMARHLEAGREVPGSELDLVVAKLAKVRTELSSLTSGREGSHHEVEC